MAVAIPAPELLAMQLEQSVHKLSVSSWAAFLLCHWQDDYQEPKQCLYPTSCLPGSDTGKIEVMTQRHGRNLSLYHHLDGRPELCDDLASVARHGRNGRMIHAQDLRILMAEDDEDDAEPLPGPGVMLDHLIKRGVKLGNDRVLACPECSWQHRLQNGNSWLCSWCGREVDGPTETKRRKV